MTVTAANPLPEDLAISDEVIRLRVWGTDQVFLLFPDRHEALIGTAATCAIRLHDPMRRVSRAHAFLQRLQGAMGHCRSREQERLYRDGARVDKLALTPGVEVSIGGGLVLLAERARWIALRSTVSRMLGWGVERMAAVDLALRGIQLAAMRRAPLILCGEHDLVPLAEALYRLTLADRPFVVYNPNRCTTETVVDQIRTLAGHDPASSR